MTITVRSSEPMEAVTAPVGEEIKSAPESKESQEQKSAIESETVESEDGSEESEFESDESESANDSEHEKPKKKGGFQRRIDKLNAAKSAAQAEAEHWKAMALKSAGDSKSESKVERAPIAEGKPSADEYETHSDYVEALTDWKIEQRENTVKAESEKSRFLTQQEQVLKSHTERVQSFIGEHDDFEELLSELDDVLISSAVREIIITSDNGPELMYELAKNKADYERICKLAPLAAARELGKIEAKLAYQSSEPKQEIKKISNAPRPLGTVGKGTASSTRYKIDDPTIPQHVYERLRAEQIKKRA